MIAVGNAQQDPVLADDAPEDAGMEGEQGAVVLGSSLQAQHVAVAVEDSGGWRMQRSETAQLRFQDARILAGEPADVLDAVCECARLHAVQLVYLRLVRGQVVIFSVKSNNC